MDEDRRGPRGRAAADNPANRFERLQIESEEPPPERVPTLYLRDASRSALSHNTSPDVPFDVSLNPYRGCEHGCVYCLAGDTPILMADGRTRQLSEVGVGDAIYGTERRGRYRRYVKTTVLDRWAVSRAAYRIVLEDGTRLIAGGDHRFLTERGWKFVTGAEQGPFRRPHLTRRNKLMGTGRFATGPDLEAPDYRRGYLCGVVRGDGHLAFYPYEREGRSHGHQYQFRLAMADTEALDRAARYLTELGVTVHRFLFHDGGGGARRMEAIRTHARDAVRRVEQLVEWPANPGEAWSRGYLAGLYDAEGSFSRGVLRISNSDHEIVGRACEGLERIGFAFVKEHVERDSGQSLEVIRLTGGLREHLRFWHTTGNAISRKRELEGAALKSDAPLRVQSIEPVGAELKLFDLTTGTGDYIADGVVSHNCYARPTHEYLGFSAGLDFESRILVKEDAPELLRRELSSPSWQPRPIGLSGVTDPYQPIERKLQLTRRCLEVLAELRNPVMLVTKNALVRRDLDLLTELARHRAVSVAISVTTLDVELVRHLEPRTAHPRRRLEAMAELNEAGVPAGVLVAPILPGLTDHEMPAILEAAAAAGARFAGYTVLRLPGAVEELFRDWLRRHFPDRAGKVLHRVAAMRGGELDEKRFGKRMRGEGIWAEQLHALFHTVRERVGIPRRGPELSAASFRRPGGDQLGLFS